MATTIGGYSVSLGLNASGLIDGSKLARGEMASLNRTLQSVVSPGERLAKQLNTLDKALADGAISVETHGEAVKRLEAKYDKLNNSVSKAATEGQSNSDKLVAQAKQLAAAYVGFEALQRGFGALKDAAERIDVLQNTSHKLGESVPNLQRFQYALAQLGNLDAAAAENALVKLTRSIGEASLGSSEMAGNFQRLGLDFKQLAQLSPVEAFQKTAAAVAAIEDPTRRMVEANRVFGKSASELLPVLNAGTDALTQMMTEADSLGGVISQIDAEMIATANDQLDRMATALEGLANQIVVQIAPAVLSITESFTGTSESISPIVRGIGAFADSMAFANALAAEVNDTLGEMAGIIADIFSGNFSGARKGVGGLFELDTIDAALLKMYAARQQAEEAAKSVRKPLSVSLMEEQAQQANLLKKKAEIGRQAAQQGVSENRSANRIAEQTRQLEKQATIQKNLQRPAVLGQVAPKPMQQAVSVAVQSLKIDSPKSLDLGGQGASDFLSELRNRQLEEKANSNSAAIKKADEQLKVQREQLAELRKMQETQPRNKR